MFMFESQREMFVWLIAAASVLLLNSHALGHQGAVELHNVSAGHIFWLPSGCDEGDSNSTVTWSRGGDPVTPGAEVMPPGVEVRGKTLWFLPADPSHSGRYTCQGRDRGETWEKTFLVSVDPGLCPAPADLRDIPEGSSQPLVCRLGNLVALDPWANITVTWLKNCIPLEKHDWTMRFSAAQDDDAGVYTCLAELSGAELHHTASHSTRLHISHEKGLEPPYLHHPRNETVVVEPGGRAELSCSAFLGLAAGDSEMFWLVDQQFTEDFPQLTEIWETMENSSGVFGRSRLSVSEVLPEFLGVPFLCVAQSPAGHASREVWLQAANHSSFHVFVAFSLAFPLALLVLGTCWLFRVDLVLASRRLRPPVAKRRSPDGKVYDAYVSYLPGLCSSGAESLALQQLPEVLERRHGYTLYIRGRDDCPGEAVHSAVSDAMRRSRRLIIILSAQRPADPSMDPEQGRLPSMHPEEGRLPSMHPEEGRLPSMHPEEGRLPSMHPEEGRLPSMHPEEGQSPPPHSQDSQGYEQLVGLYDALTQNGLRVILVEADAGVDYGGLPESLRYLRRKQGALRWRPGGSGNNNNNNSSPTAPPNGHFWKYLRYHMPSEPAGRRTTAPLTIL